MKHSRLRHQFVQYLPAKLEPGVLYVSMEYATAAHCCCCGCGEEVVTPFSPTDWRMAFDGETISIWPSIGNWNLPCRSHYVIEQGRVIGAGHWSEAQVAAERQRDKTAKDAYYGTLKEPTLSIPSAPTTVYKQPKGLWQKVLSLFFKS